MKRLKYYLAKMDNNPTNFREMYEASAVIPPHTPGNVRDFYETVSDPVFWISEDISMAIEFTNKMAWDRPTVLLGIPAPLLEVDSYCDAVADACYRQWLPYLNALNAELYNRHKTPEQTGYYYMAKPGGEILKRNTAYFRERPRKCYWNQKSNIIIHYPREEVGESQMCLFLRFQVQLPHRRNKVLSMLTSELPETVLQFVNRFDRGVVHEVIKLAEKQRGLREWLSKSEYCAFLANGSILPRDSKTGGPLKGAVPFEAPLSDTVEACGLKGLGIRKGVTVITGGGYSGKSTVLNTISAGICDHILGDGRELCVTDASAVTISAEDGRSVKCLDISPFIAWIPGGSTEDFSTEHASGSTSQAANILESVDCGAKLLLIDEDKSATNFMIRDGLMKELIRREPITPFTERVNELYDACGVSTILVIGGSGEYLGIADSVLMMDEYLMYNVTGQAKRMSERCSGREERKPASWTQRRVLLSEGFTSYPERYSQEKLAAPDVGFILIGDERIDTNMIHDISCQEQRTALAFMLRLLENRQNDATVNLDEQLFRLYREIEEEGLDFVYSGFFPECERFLALPRPCDLRTVINRMRMVKYERQ